MAVDRDIKQGTICLHQSLYVRDLIKKFNMQDAAIVRTPADACVTLSKEMSPQTKEEIKAMENVPYRSLLGALLHLANFTRPDIALAVNICSRCATNYGLEHWKALKRILRYLKGTIDSKTGKSPGLMYCRDVQLETPVIGYVDADYVITMHGAQIQGNPLWAMFFCLVEPPYPGSRPNSAWSPSPQRRLSTMPLQRQPRSPFGCARSSPICVFLCTLSDCMKTTKPASRLLRTQSTTRGPSTSKCGHILCVTTC